MTAFFVGLAFVLGMLYAVSCWCLLRAGVNPTFVVLAIAGGALALYFGVKAGELGFP